MSRTELLLRLNGGRGVAGEAEQGNRDEIGERIEDHTIVRKSLGVMKQESKECRERE